VRILILSLSLLFIFLAWAYAQGIDEFLYVNKRLGFTFSVPSYDWEIYTDMPGPMVFGGYNRNTRAHLAITFYENAEDEAPSYGDIKKLVEKTEQNNYNTTKENYERVEMTEYTVAGKKGIWLEYTCTEDGVDKHGIVVVFSTQRYYFFCGIDVMERDFEITLQDFHSMMNSIIVN